MSDMFNLGSDIKSVYNAMKLLEDYIKNSTYDKNFINELKFIIKAVLTGSGSASNNLTAGELETLVDTVNELTKADKSGSPIQIIKNVLSSYAKSRDNAIDLKLAEKTFNQFKARASVVENIDSKLLNAETQGAEIYSTKDSLIDAQYNNKKAQAEKHNEEREKIHENIKLAREAYDERVKLAFSEYKEKVKLLQFNSDEENSALEESTKNREEKNAISLELLNQELEQELINAKSSLDAEIEKNNEKLSILMFTQELERIELDKSQAYSLYIFDEIGKAFATHQDGMRTDLTNTQADVIGLINKYHELVSIQKTAEELRKEAEFEVKVEQESAAHKAGSIDAFNTVKNDKYLGDFTETGTPTLENNKKFISDKPIKIKSYTQTEIDAIMSEAEKRQLEGDIAPAMHNGGIFRASNGHHEGLALLRNNEMILTPEQQQGLLNGKSGDLTNNFNIANMHIRDESDIDKLAMRLNTLQQIRARQV